MNVSDKLGKLGKIVYSSVMVIHNRVSDKCGYIGGSISPSKFKSGRWSTCGHLGTRFLVQKPGGIFWCTGFLPYNASSYRNKDFAALCCMHKCNKKREYGERIHEVHMVPLLHRFRQLLVRWHQNVQSSYMKLAGEIVDKQKLQYTAVMNWLRCRLSFTLLRSAIQAI